MADRMWTLRLRDASGAETKRDYKSRKSAVAAGRRAERGGKALWWEASPTYVDPSPAARDVFASDQSNRTEPPAGDGGTTP